MPYGVGNYGAPGGNNQQQLLAQQMSQRSVAPNLSAGMPQGNRPIGTVVPMSSLGADGTPTGAGGLVNSQQQQLAAANTQMNPQQQQQPVVQQGTLGPRAPQPNQLLSHSQQQQQQPGTSQQQQPGE